MRLALVGYGRMGRTIAALAKARGHEVALVVDEAENPGGEALARESLSGIQAAFEFTTPAAAPQNLLRLAEAGVPTVCGTTGWDAELPRISAVVRERAGALVHAANFSVGVHLFLRTAREMARRFAGHSAFDAFILEEHHAQKLDAPSGTALTLQQLAAAADPARRFPITSVRAGAIPGIHTLTYDGPHDTVALTHTARSREGFAAGALLAAEWLPGRKGVFTFENVLFGDDS
ncbi:MAG TPA: dihydrodipicolinate reductase C-terminal domain-containing protein [Gemmatimonadales bacterium]|nr:dihydrodipicolinate reductase C-terminal domain-containing protein [Gemmatimonadales bacterium]